MQDIMFSDYDCIGREEYSTKPDFYSAAYYLFFVVYYFFFLIISCFPQRCFIITQVPY